MFKIMIGQRVLCDSTVQMSSVISPVLKMEVNKVWSFEFTLPPDHPEYGLVERSEEISVSFDGVDPVFVGEIVGTSVDFYGQKTVHCEDQFGYLNGALMAPQRYTGKNVIDIIALAVTEYNAQCGDKPISIGVVSTTHTDHDLAFSVNYDTIMDMLQANIIDKVGGYLYMYTQGGIRYLGYKEEPDSSGTTQIIKIGNNLLDFVRDSDSSDLCSILVPLGAKLEDQDIEGVEKRLTIRTDSRPTDRIESASLISAIGRHVKRRIWDSVDDPDRLYELASAWMSTQLADVTIEATAYDLNLEDERIQRIHLFDSVRILSEPHGLDTRFPVMELELNLDDPASDKIALGKTDVPKLSKTTADTAAAVSDAPTYIDVNSIAGRRAAQILQNSTNGYVQFVYDANGVLTEILIKDLADPANKWWRWNISGLGYTKDGGQTYEAALTMEGQLLSNFAEIGGWNVNENGFMKIVADPDDAMKQYSVAIQRPDPSDPANSSVLSFGTSTDGGENFYSNFVIFGDGSVHTWSDMRSPSRIYMHEDNDADTSMLLGQRGIEINGQYVHQTKTMYSAGRMYITDEETGTYMDLTERDGLRFYDANNNKIGSFSKTDWGTGVKSAVVDGHVWRCLENGKTRICSTTVNVLANVNNPWGAIFAGTAGQTNANLPSIRYPYNFAFTPKCSVTLRSNSYGDGWLSTAVDYSPTTVEDARLRSPAYDICRGTQRSVDMFADYIVIGDVE